MTRAPLALRPAAPSDVGFLVELWRPHLRRAAPSEQTADLERIIDSVSRSDDRRIVVATYAGEPVGAAYLEVSTMSQLNLEPCVTVLWPSVVPPFRRKGVGRALMEAAVSFAEERGIGHLVSAASVASRDGNRYLSRLGFGPQVTVRAAATPAARAKLTAQVPPRVALNRTKVETVLAARRQLRRAGRA